MSERDPSSIELGALLNPEDRVDGEDEIDWSNLRKISWRRMIVLSKKTFSDLYSTKGLIISIIIMIFLPLIISLSSVIFGFSSIDYGSLSVYSAAMKISFSVITYLYFWTFGLVFSIILGIKAGKQIVTEVESGTMLMLVSKPIGRFQIFLGKYIAVMLYGALISILSLVLSMWIIVLVLTGNISHFIQILPFIFVTFLYTMFVMSIFVTISMALSAIMKKSRSVLLAVIGIVALTFILFTILTVFGLGPYLGAYYIHYINLGYHFANVYVLLIDIFNALPNSILWQMSFNIVTGIYTDSSTDSTQNISLGGLEHNNYVHPMVSLIILVGFTLLLLAFGLRSLKKKEISN